MKSLENQKFENWKDAFSNAEVDPPDAVWHGIELHLSATETDTLKRRVVFFQRLAAASVLFAFLLGGASIWYLASNETQDAIANVRTQSSKGEGTVADNGTNLPAGAHQETSSAINASSDGSGSAFLSGQSNQSGKSKMNGKNQATEFNQANTGLAENIAQFAMDNQETVRQIPLQNSSSYSAVRQPRGVPTLASSMFPEVEIKLNGEPTRVVAGAIIFENAITEKKKTKEDIGWWASVGASAGSYNANTSSPNVFSNVQFAQAKASSSSLGANSSVPSSSIAASSEASLGKAFSYGVNVGKKISKRWAIVTGMSYLNQSVGYTSNVAVLDANNTSRAFVADMASDQTAFTSTSPYSVNSVSEFLTVPLQAGYTVLDRKIGIQFNAGVSSDFFVKNTSVDEAGKLASYSVGAGGNSVYQSVNWTGLASTEFSYKVSSRYRVSLLPGMRYGFNPVLKSGVAAPIIWDVGVRFKYVF